MRSRSRRMVSFALVMLLLASVIGLSATQTFINKTGATVTGIKIEFSKSVRITRHDSVFPDQSPTERAQEFTFSGGELRNLGRFSVTWTPSSAKVTNYDWIEKTQPTQTAQTSSPSNKQESGLPDPNTPPILYGDNYPGSDEPLYQPKDDEQIWLTDLGGHADIYDNDGIRINFASGFDKATIGHIEWYRNGIHLPFLDDKLEITNAQMKTFTGLPEEHSPASSHTDHAITGYDYQANVYLTDGTVARLKTTVESTFKYRGEVYAFLVQAWSSWIVSNHISDAQIRAYFLRLRELGFDGISVNMNYYMDTPYDNLVRAQFDDDLCIVEPGNTTASDPELNRILSLANEVGLKTEVRCEIRISKKFLQTHLDQFFYGANIRPSNIGQWFSNYSRLMLELAKMLESNNVDRFTPFTEMDSLEKYPDYIRAFYDNVSTVFSGELGFEESTSHFVQGYAWTPDLQHGTFDKFAGTFFDWKSPSGKPLLIEMSCWAIPLDNTKDQRYSVMVKNFGHFWSVALQYYKAHFPDNEIVFGEIGAYPFDGYAIEDAAWNVPANERTMDLQEFNDVWAAYLRGAEELGIRSLTVWVTPICDLQEAYVNAGNIVTTSTTMKMIDSMIQ